MFIRKLEEVKYNANGLSNHTTIDERNLMQMQFLPIYLLKYLIFPVSINMDGIIGQSRKSPCIIFNFNAGLFDTGKAERNTSR